MASELELLMDICESYEDEIKRLRLENELLKQNLQFERNIGQKFRASLVAAQNERDNLKRYNRNSDEVFGAISVYENRYLKDGQIMVTNKVEI